MSLNDGVIVAWFLVGVVFAIDSWKTSDLARERRSFWLSAFFMVGSVIFAVSLN